MKKRSAINEGVNSVPTARALEARDHPVTSPAEEECLLTRCRIVFRNLIHRYPDGTVICKIEPDGEGEVWKNGELLYRLGPELMAVYEAALIREELRHG